MSNTFNFHPRAANIPDRTAPIKVNSARILAPDFAHEVSEARMKVAAIMTRADLDNVLNVKEQKAIFGKHLSTIYRYLNGELSLPSDVMVVLVKVLAERGHTELLSLMLPKGYTIVGLPEEVTPKLSLRDEFVEAVTNETEAVRSFDKKDFKKAEHFAGKAVTILLAMVGQAQTLLS